MQKDENNIPDHIFGWIENKDYGSLSNSEKNEIQAYFSEEEYNDLYQVLGAISKSSSHVRREAVLERFDRHYSKTKMITVQSRGFDFLKAAAILVPLLSLAAFLVLKDSGPNLVSMSSIRDTVFVETRGAADTVVQYDTIYRDVIQKSTERQVSSGNVATPVVSSGDIGTFDVLSLDQLDGAMNVSKGNSLKHDTLWQMFEAARL